MFQTFIITTALFSRSDLRTVSTIFLHDKKDVKVGWNPMETVELHDIEEKELRGLLAKMSEVWKSNSGFFDTGLRPVFHNFGELEDLLFGVHVFSHGNGAKIFIILTEYHREDRTATFNINARNITGWFAPSASKQSEVKFRRMLEKLTYEQLEAFAIETFYQEEEGIFICPNCNAQYMMKVLHVTRYGQIECQNCKRLFDPIELGAASHDS